ncbi:MAG: LamG domain-containing protein [Spirochaetota bacterium]
MKHMVFGMVAAAVLAAALSAADASLIGYWNFDEGSGMVAKDSSGNNLTATNKGGWADGKKGKGLLLTGDKTKIIEFSVPTDKQPGKGSYSIALWMNPSAIDIDSKQKQRRAFGLDNWPTAYTVIDVLGDGAIQFATGYKIDDTRKGGLTVNTKGKAVIGQWMHIAAVFAVGSKKMKIYMNGTLSGEAAIPDTYEFDLQIGTRLASIGSTWQSFAGVIDEVYYYKRALSADEVSVLAQ